jgi:cytoskeleton protein RodZ
LAYDLASQRSKIPFAIHRKRETGLPSFGEKLKQEREKRKITLEQISSSTKIGTRMLQALEEDKFHQLPGGIFNKGFVRAYSRFVGLDEDQIVADYLQASGDAPPVSTEIVSREEAARESADHISRMEASTSEAPRQIPWGLFAAVLLLIALVLYLWSHHRSEYAKEPVAAVPNTAPGQMSGAVSSTTSNPSGGESPPAPAKTTQPSTAATIAKPKQDSSTVAIPEEFTVVIQAREESWISITTDGNKVSSELLEAGAERAVRARKEVILKIGNAGGVDLRLDGKKLAAGGEFGEVKTVTLGPHGIVPDAPEPTITP